MLVKLAEELDEFDDDSKTIKLSKLTDFEIDSLKKYIYSLDKKCNI